MARKLLAGVTATVALGFVGPAAAVQMPILRSVSVVHRHLVLSLAVVDVQPTGLSVAKRRAVDADGVLRPKNIRLREAIQLPPSATGAVRWQSPKALRPGTYFVQVKGVEIAGVTDCPRFQRNCNTRWSNVRRVVVPR